MKTLKSKLAALPRRVRLAGALAVGSGIDFAVVLWRFNARIAETEGVYQAMELPLLIAFCCFVLVGAVGVERAIFHNPR